MILKSPKSYFRRLKTVRQISGKEPRDVVFHITLNLKHGLGFRGLPELFAKCSRKDSYSKSKARIEDACGTLEVLYCWTVRRLKPETHCVALS